MNGTVTFDTLAFTERLTASGVPEKQAKEHARALSEAFEARELVTHKDWKLAIAELKADLIKWVVGTALATAGIIVGAFFTIIRIGDFNEFL